MITNLWLFYSGCCVKYKYTFYFFYTQESFIFTHNIKLNEDSIYKWLLEVQTNNLGWKLMATLYTSLVC